jgi:hypothetical protein
VHGGRIIPEAPVDSVACLNPFGYAEAKLVCERILEHTREMYPEDMEVSYIRVGQVAGSSETGYWNGSEHFPALVASSKSLGTLPELQNVCLPLSFTFTYVPVSSMTNYANIDPLLAPRKPRRRRHIRDPPLAHPTEINPPPRKPNPAILARPTPHHLRRTQHPPNDPHEPMAGPGMEYTHRERQPRQETL